MNTRIEAMREKIRRGDHHPWRASQPISILAECEAGGLSWSQRAARLTRRQCEAERVVIDPDEKIVFTRTLPAEIPALYSPEAYQQLTVGRTLHELGPISNICADWGKVLSQGLLERRKTALATRERYQRSPGSVEFLDGAVETIDAVLALTARYAAEATHLERADLAEILEQVPAKPPRTFHEALQALRILQAVLWLSGHYHVGLGRLDQYLWPYLKADLAAGRLDPDAAEELLAEFFLSLNKDSDLYPGLQQGDTGQAIVLGGVDREGKEAVNELTWMALRVLRNLAMPNPQVNLRITPTTGLDLLCLAAELTRKGPGFPQYSNDDVVIPSLVAAGYRLKDARDYGVAAGGEFLIPGRSMELVNIGAVSFPAAVNLGLRAGIKAGDDFAAIQQRVRANIRQQVRALVKTYEQLLLPPAPYYSVLMSDCLETGKDLSQGASYNNFGIHGDGAAYAAEALAAGRQFVFEEKSVSAEELIMALDNNYAGAEELRAKFTGQAPGVGHNDPAAGDLMVTLFDDFAEACEEIPDNRRGGMIRPGLGSASYPAPGEQVIEPVSIFQTYARLDYKRLYNGGPITLELSGPDFEDEGSIRKLALLVRTFAQLGGQQLQLTSLNPAILLDAQAHPE